MMQDYENDALNNLKKILINKWDFVTMQAEEQVRWKSITKQCKSCKKLLDFGSHLCKTGICC